MSKFKSFLIDRAIIPNLVKHYVISSENNEINDFLIELVEKIPDLDESLENKKLVDKFDLDIFVDVYEKIVPHSQRKTMGEFFTPVKIVNSILKSVGYTTHNDIDDKKLIDLSCGSGSFLVRAAEVLSDRLDTQSKLTCEKAKEIIEKIKTNIFGIDINPIACILCQINLYFILLNHFDIIFKNDKTYTIPIFNIFNIDAIKFEINEKYDFVVGNPPYLFIRAIPEERRKLIEELPLITNKGQYDYYQIFIEIGIKILKKQGKLGYIVPDSLLALSNRKSLRKYIFSNTMIKNIDVVGSGFKDPVVSSIIIVLQKELIEERRLNNKIMIEETLGNSRRENLLLQKDIPEWDYKYLIHLNQMDINILKHLNSKFPKLKSLMDDSKFSISINRGVELGKDGKIIFCNYCKKYFPLPKSNLICIKCGARLNSKNSDKIILDTLPEDSEGTYELFIYSLNRYSVKEYKYIKMNVEGINYKDSNNYLNRIVIRQLSQENHICAAYEEKALSSQSVYNVKIHRSPIENFNHYYLIGLLNSQLLSYYFLKTFGSYKSLFPRILIEKLKTLPIKVPLTQNERELSNLISNNVKEIINLRPENKTKLSELQNKIDILVNKLFLIKKDVYEHILNSLPELNIIKK
ncbi:MAG: N-6 DNA methylase [Candidatus Hermodarchaeota archaeon]